jgi:hypothetical protein
MRSASRALALVASLILGIPGTAAATTALFVSEIDHAALSTAVVRGTIGEQVVERIPSTGRLVTRTTVRVDRVLYGVAPQTLVITQAGGVLGDRAERIAGDATLYAGEDVVLFVREQGGAWFLTALEQSKYAVVPSLDGPLLEREIGEGLFLRTDSGALVPWVDDAPGVPLTLARLESILSSTAPTGRPVTPGRREVGR